MLITRGRVAGRPVGHAWIEIVTSITIFIGDSGGALNLDAPSRSLGCRAF